MRTRAFLTTAVAATLLTACGGTGATDGTGDPGPTPSAPVEAGSDREHAPRRSDPSGPYDLVLEHLRVEERARGDRVVLTFRGRGTAGWTAEYVDQAVLDGSGRVVDLDAGTLLSIAVTGTPTRPSDRGRRVPVTVGGEVADVFVGAPWEGVTQVFLGLHDGRSPYRISTLGSPSRLVVDLGGGQTPVIDSTSSAASSSASVRSPRST